MKDHVNDHIPGMNHRNVFSTRGYPVLQYTPTAEYIDTLGRLYACMHVWPVELRNKPDQLCPAG